MHRSRQGDRDIMFIPTIDSLDLTDSLDIIVIFKTALITLMVLGKHYILVL